MRVYLRFAILFLPVFYNLIIFGQLPNSAWRDHLPYSNVKNLAEVNNKIFCATSGGMFSYDKSDHTIEKFSKVNGLADFNITALGFSENLQIFVIGYESGNIDIIKNDSIINIPDIKRKLFAGEKTINNVYFIDNYAYLACGFGIVVVNLQRKEIKETYLFGPLGSQIYVNDITSDGVRLYASTRQGVFSVLLSSPNPVDYNYWERLSVLPDETADYKSLVFYNNKLLTIYQNPLTSRSDIIEITDIGSSVWSPEQENYRVLDVQNGNLIAITDYKTQVYNSNFTVIYQQAALSSQFALFDKSGILWLADTHNGLLRSENGNLESNIHPNGPQYFDVSKLVYSGGDIWACSGGDNNRYDLKGAYRYRNERWNNFNRVTLPDIGLFHSINEIAINPSDPDHVFGGSLGTGIVEFNDNNVTIYDETNSVFKNIEGYEHGYIFVSGMTFDQRNNLWVSTTFAEDPVYVRRTDGTWENIKLKYDGFGINTRVGDILATRSGQLWLILIHTGILVFRENADGSISERFLMVINQEGELMERFYSLAEDADGNIWVGTGTGPVVYYNPASILEQTGTIAGNQIIIPRNDGTNNGDPLLANEKINCIKIDGANRKWFGTEKSGAFLMSDDGKKEIHKFNSDNSPLFSDNVLSIEVNDKNGEVFFATDKGILSFKGQATKGDDDFYDVYVYPNPVRETYRGDITITGLVANVNVKITDISGNIVYETTALGGQAIWDGTNFRGERVQTGVYLVFCTNDDGSKTHVTKLLFIH